ELAGGQNVNITSDAAWRSSKTVAPGWDTAGFDDSDWPKALSIGSYGDAPWGALDAATDDSAFGPQCTGIPGGVRIIYVPDSQSIEAKALDPGAAYSAVYFDPVTGHRTDPAVIHAGPDGSWLARPPAGSDHDWVLILQPHPQT